MIYKLLCFLSGLWALLPVRLIMFAYYILYPFPSYFFVGIRAVVMSRFLNKDKTGVVLIFNNVEIRNVKGIKIKNNVSIHPFCYLDGYGGIDIGENVSIAHNTSIISFEHTWCQFDKPIKYNKSLPGKIIIEDDVWIGCGVRILSGSYIEKRTVVAAGAVVKGYLESGYLYGGVPAKKIKRLK